MSKRSKKENELLEFLSEDERKVYEEFEAKLKAKRDVAVKRQKKEIKACILIQMSSRMNLIEVSEGRHSLIWECFFVLRVKIERTLFLIYCDGLYYWIICVKIEL